MLPADDDMINSFTVPYSDQFLLYSTLLDDAHHNTDHDLNHNPYSPFSFYDQNMAAAHPLFLSLDDQHLGLQTSSSLVQQYDHEEEEPMLTAFEEFTMTDHTSTKIRPSFETYCGTENFQHNNGLTSDPNNRISTSAVEGMKIDKVSKNVNLSKKDRHSKINTAQGPRDRRMRLSLDIAKRFFGLQDMLGFDKASKTVDWLLSKSQSEINKVVGIKTYNGNNVATKSSSDSIGASECCEEVSEVVNKDEIVSQSGDQMDTTNLVNKKTSAKTKKKITTGKAVSASSLRNGFNNQAKESREKARARAKERTKEKKLLLVNLKNHKKQYENVNDHISNMDHTILNHQVLRRPHAYYFIDQDESLANTFHSNPSSSSCIFKNLQQQISGTSDHHQLPFEEHDQFYAKPWETYNL